MEDGVRDIKDQVEDDYVSSHKCNKLFNLSKYNFFYSQKCNYFCKVSKGDGNYATVL